MHCLREGRHGAKGLRSQCGDSSTKGDDDDDDDGDDDDDDDGLASTYREEKGILQCMLLDGHWSL